MNARFQFMEQVSFDDTAHHTINSFYFFEHTRINLVIDKQCIQFISDISALACGMCWWIFFICSLLPFALLGRWRHNDQFLCGTLYAHLSVNGNAFDADSGRSADRLRRTI